MTRFWDRLGISTSLVCMVHCLITPVAVVLMPYATKYLLSGWIHLVLASLVVPVAIWSFHTGYRLHGDRRICVFGFLGLACVLIALSAGFSPLTSNYEVPFMTAGGTLLISAHILNLRGSRRCQSCGVVHEH